MPIGVRDIGISEVSSRGWWGRAGLHTCIQKSVRVYKACFSQTGPFQLDKGSRDNVDIF